MAQIELTMPKMGESIIEATILNWVKQVGDSVEVDETILEIATDKVDSEVPSPVDGTLAKILFEPDAVVAVGDVIALIETDAAAPLPNDTAGQASAGGEGDGNAAPPPQSVPAPAGNPARPGDQDFNQPYTEPGTKPGSQPGQAPAAPQPARAAANGSPAMDAADDDRYYSPLVRTMAQKENIGAAELATIPGTGKGGRVNKSDMLAYLKRRDNSYVNGTAGQGFAGRAAAGGHANGGAASSLPSSTTTDSASTAAPAGAPPSSPDLVANGSGGDEIIAMDRMRKLIAKHMVDSKRTSPHVTSFIEVDVTDIVNWRNGVKANFQKKHGQKITFTPIFVEAVAKAIKDFPMVNVSVEGENIIKKADINIGMAAALPTGNLIVPVIKNADQLNLLGVTKAVNDLAGRARAGKLKPAETQGGTFTLTNVGTFGNVMGTPIINQPQVAILAVGAIRKKPAVVETEYGDLIAVRQMMFMSLSYDHRVVDGFLGGSFLRRVGDYLEAFDVGRSDV